jgi:energy-coupling factor transporter ATP-binding protein EcfA2
MTITLKLTNFKCFESATYAFDGGFALISGASGTGKTTIFMAMHFAITGEGRKLTMYGKKSCSVELTMRARERDISIIRAKGPCRLRVTIDDTVYEDNEAQGMIDNEYPQWELGYVPQRTCKSFFAMTPVDKLKFIEKIAFGAEDALDSIHKKCNVMIRDRKDALNTTSLEKSTLQTVLKDFDIDCDQDVIIDVPDDIDEIKSEIARLDRDVDKINRARETMDRVVESLSELPEIDPTVVDVCLDSLIRKTAKYDRYASEMKKLASLSKPEIVDEKLRTDMKRVVLLRAKVKPYDAIKSRLDHLLEYKVNHAIKLTCPACFAGLKLWDNDLNVIGVDESVSTIDYDTMEQCQKNIAKLELDASSLSDYRSELDGLNLAYPDIDACFQIRVLDNLAAANDRYRDLSELCERLACESPNCDLANVTERIKRNEKTITVREMLTKEMAAASPIAALDIDGIRARLEQKRLDLIIAQEKRDKAEFQKVKIKIRSLETRRAEQDSGLKRAVKLQSLVKTAEQIAMQRAITCLNLRAQIYLDKFLDDVKVSLSFNGKIEVNVLHNQHESDIASLSGGEFARLTLAFAIAMAEMNNVGLLLLDESFASLDADTTSTVVETLKENFNGAVIVIAHQTTRGVFDQVIEM